jgi:hypothetical protein
MWKNIEIVIETTNGNKSKGGIRQWINYGIALQNNSLRRKIREN